MKKFFLVLGLVEIMGAMVLFFMPQLLFISEWNDSYIHIFKLIGIGTFCIGAIAIQCFKYFEYSAFFKFLVLIFFLFHALMAFHLYSLYNTGFVDHIGPAGLHLGLSVLILFFYYKDAKNWHSLSYTNNT